MVMMRLSTVDALLKIIFAQGLPRPWGAELSDGEELQLFTLEYLDSLTPEGVLSLVPLGSNEVPESLLLGKDDDEEEKEERFL